MAEYDGSIRIGVILNTEKAQKTLQSLREQLVRQTNELDAQVKAVKKLEAQYEKLTSVELRNQSIEKTQKSLEKAKVEAEKLDAELQRLQQQQQMNISGNIVDPELNNRIREVSDQLAEADARVDKLNSSIEKLRIPPESTEEAKQLKEQIAAGKEKLEESKLAAQNTADRIRNLEGASQSWVAKLGQAASRLKSTIGRSIKTSANSAKTLHSRMEKVGRSRGLDKARKSASKFGESLRRAGRRLREIVSGALLFNIISRALTALTKKMGEYLLANKDFASSLSTIKGNLLTAFQPIYEAVMPALNKLMETLREASAVAAKFVAGLFGTTAEKAQQNAKALHDQAKATEEVAEETKKAEKFLASFDTIEILGKKEEESKKSDEKEKNEAKFDQDYSDVKVPPWLEKLGEVIKSIKDALKDLFAPIKEAWDKYGAPVIEALKRAFGSVWDLIKAIGRTFMEIWQSPLIQATLKLIMDLFTLILDIVGDIADTFRKVWESGEGKRLLENLVTLFKTILEIIFDIAAAFREAWSNYGEEVVRAWSNYGEEVVRALFFMLNSVLELLNSIGQAFRDAWNDGSGQKIWETILQIASDVFNIVGELAGRLKEAWEANGNGKAIWDAILDSIQAVLDFIHKVTDATLEWAKNLNLEPIVSGIRNVLEQIEPIIENIGKFLSEIYEECLLPLFKKLLEDWIPWVLEQLAELLDWLSKLPDFTVIFKEALKSVIKVLSSLFELVKSVWELIEPIAKFIAGALYLAITAIAGAIGLVCDAISWLIDLISSAINAIKDFFDLLFSGKWKDFDPNLSFSGGFGGFGATMPYSSSGGNAARMARLDNMARIAAYTGTENLPHLAQGAVISPNHEFLAVLGDQRAGKNIEAPLSTIEQALENVLSRRGESGGTNVEINFTGSLSQLARILQPQIKVAEQRRGPSLINLGGSSYV